MGAKAIIDDKLKIPICDEINIEAIKQDLTISYGRKRIKLWELSKKKDYLLVPKFYITDYEEYNIEFEKIINESNKNIIDIDDKIVLRENQKVAWEQLKNSEGGFLVLGTGRGKSVLALKKASYEKKRFKIFVHNTYLFEQWKRFIKEFLILDGKDVTDEDIGEIKQGVFDYDKEICVVMIQSLLSKIKNNELPKDFSNSSDLWIFDEGHHVPAAEFIKSLQCCKGQIYILTATEKRPDRKENIVKWFCGDIIYKDVVKNLVPKICFVSCPLEYDYNPEGHVESITSEIAKNEDFNDFKLDFIREHIEGRKALCVSSRVSQLKYMNKHLKSALIVGDVDETIREKLIKQNKVSFIIDQLGNEGLDVPELDTMFILLPVTSDQTVTAYGTTEYLGNNFNQLIGRICRTHPDKKEPICYIFDDIKIEPLHRMCEKLKTYLTINKISFDELNASQY